MIVRISGEDQYVLPDGDRDQLSELEGSVLALIDGGRADGFEQAYAKLLDFVRGRGTPVPADELQASDVILPPADLSFEEAGREFSGEGLIPD